MSYSTRNRILILIIVFTATLLVTLLYLHIYPESDLFKGENTIITSDNTSSIDTPLSQDNNNEVTNSTEPKDNISYTILTGASANHFCPLKSFLYSIHETIKGYEKARMVVYDLGLDDKQRKELGRLQSEGYLTELKIFDWSKYPSFWDIKQSRGEYAWKPGMVYEISKEYPGIIIWLDSGTKVQKKFFENFHEFLGEYNGFISPKSSGVMKDWTHPGVYEYFNEDHKKFDNLPNCNGASVVFDTRRVQSLIDNWYKCALVKDCIAPPGSSRKNHRQDQALLTYFAAKEGRLCGTNREYFGFHTHDDSNCKNEIIEYEQKKAQT